MTNEQKIKIRELLDEGYSYGQISKKLGIPRTTIGSFYKAHIENQPNTKADKTGCCKFCGKKIDQNEGKRKKIFCSQSCRLTWWAKHPEMKNKKAVYSFVCPICGSSFSAYGNKKRIYCSRECYIKGRYKNGGSYDSRTI